MARMSSNFGARLGWELRRIGWPLLLSGAMLLLAAALGWQVRQHGLRESQLRQSLGQLRAHPPAPAAAPVDVLADFAARLPAHALLPDQLKTLHALAAQHGIALARADYKAVPDEQGGFLRYEMSMPVKADYLRLQGFLIAALKALPALSLEQVSFQRGAIASSEVEARLQLVLFTALPGATK